jgi:hypothetical protein
MQVRLTKKLGKHEPGSEHDVTDATAKRLIRKDAAEKVGAKNPRRAKADLEPHSDESLHYAVEQNRGQQL